MSQTRNQPATNSGTANLPLFSGAIPPWLFERMVRLSGAITTAIVEEYGTAAFLSRLSDPYWFQSFGAVIGMDWNSSGVTTAVMSALKRSLLARSAELGLYVCGGKGKESMQTPDELLRIGHLTGLDGDALAYASRLSAKVDNTAIQDGFQIYLHSFVVDRSGNWSVIQQGMNTKGERAMARRYHWHSAELPSFVIDPHTAICGPNQGDILNLVTKDALATQQSIISIATDSSAAMQNEIRKLSLPTHYGVKAPDVDFKRLGALLAVTREMPLPDFESLLMLKGVGPRTLQSLALVSEVIHGTAHRFHDPARFAMAHGSKGGKPFAVPTNVYDETISWLETAVNRAKLGHTDKTEALSKLHSLVLKAEDHFEPDPNQPDAFDRYMESERMDSWQYGGRTMKGCEQPPVKFAQDGPQISAPSGQLSLF